MCHHGDIWDHLVEVDLNARWMEYDKDCDLLRFQGSLGQNTHELDVAGGLSFSWGDMIE